MDELNFQENVDSVVEPLALSGSELAKRLGLSLRHIRRMDAAGKIPRPVRFGRSVRWPLSGPNGIIRWLEQGCPDRATIESKQEVSHVR